MFYTIVHYIPFPNSRRHRFAGTNHKCNSFHISGFLVLLLTCAAILGGGSSCFYYKIYKENGSTVDTKCSK